MIINIRDDINNAYIPFFQDTHRIDLLYGGAGAGKSYAVVQKAIIFTLLYRNRKLLFVRKTLPALKLTTLAMMENILTKYKLNYSINKSDLIIHFNRNQMIFKSIDDPRKIKSLTDVDMIVMEEMTELTENDFNQLLLRLRGQKTMAYRQIIGIFNPISKSHWIYKRFFTRKDPDVRAFKFTYKDNRFINDDYKEVLEGLKDVDENTYRVYALGEWGTMGTLVFSNYVIEEFDVPSNANFFNGADFGFNNPSAYVMMFERDGEIYIYDEIYKSKLTNPDFIELVEQKHQQWKVPKLIYADPAEPDRLQEFADHDFYVGDVIKKNKASQINVLKQFKLHIHPRCVHTIDEIQQYHYAVDKYGNILEEPVKFQDHAMDAIRYGVYNHLTGYVDDKLEFI